MRWDALFADLEQQLDAATALDLAAEVAELTRAERATVALVDRARGGLGAEVRVAVRSGAVVRGTLRDVGQGWLLVGGAPREHLVVLAAVTTLAGLGGVVAPPAGAVLRRLGLGTALRAIARDRTVVMLRTGTTELHGRVDAVGADHLELALADVEAGRPTGATVLVPFTAIEVVTST